ncbi:hypothetical protein SAY87_016288 [Trapa incisa]|uniref:Uncharacterized protein n=1 Tax=Trapa incisa TaxID=236973 RepID=A0AAN7QVB0_9MYRT|nr:hypothetical protein SAY87_016288 [Trapa incisa]
MAQGDRVLTLRERIKATPDGVADAAKQNEGCSTSTSHRNIKFDPSGDEINMPFHLLIQTFSNYNLMLCCYLLLLPSADGRFYDGIFFFWQTEEMALLLIQKPT